MGPYPHQAPKSVISETNPVGTDGFEFVEFASHEPDQLEALFTQMGYQRVAHHASKAISLWRQGQVNFLLNAESDSHAMRFCNDHGPCAPSMAWRVADAQHAFEHAIACGAKAYEGNDKSLDVPAIVGVGGSLLYFIDTYNEQGSCYDNAFVWTGEPNPQPTGNGFYYLDHLTHNVFRGNMDTWWHFYRDLFGFRQIHFFNIAGKMTGLVSRAITSPCGKIRIPLNESTDDKSQIETYLQKYKGEGIQHIAVGTENLYDAADLLAEAGLKFMPGPPETYYNRSQERVKGHEEPLERMQKHGILIDGEGVIDDRQGNRQTRILLQIFSKTVIGPIFFEFIQRKGDEGFGEGNFKALFESIEEEQIRTGELRKTA
ncbi:MAG: 4-hydroxyphenylpyruvate dioxygenase [Granulosicoccus sp.]